MAGIASIIKWWRDGSTNSLDGVVSSRIVVASASVVSPFHHITQMIAPSCEWVNVPSDTGSPG